MEFDASGRLLGQVVENAGMDMLLVFVGEPHFGGALIHDMEMYEYSDGAAALYATARYEEIRVNQPIDESLFQ